MKPSVKRKSALLTLSILLSLSVPTYAAEADSENADTVKTPDVVVTATRTEEEVKVIPQTVEVITKEKIEQLGATDVYSALRLASNIDVTRTGMAGHNVMIRGMDTNHTLILIDGKRQAGEGTGDTQNVYALDRVSLSNIERIEIVRGSASAQYGSDALGGVINIITKKSEKPGVLVGASTGTDSIDNYYHIDLGKQGKFSGNFDVRFTDVRKNRDGKDDNSNYYGPKQQFNFSGTYDLGDNKQLDLTLGYYNEHTKADYADATLTNLWDKNNPYVVSKDKKEWYDYKRYDVSLGYSGETDNGDWMIRTYYSRLNKENKQHNYRPDLPDILNYIPGAFGMPIANLPSDRVAPRYDWDKVIYNLWGVEGKNTMQIADDHLLTFGGEYRNNSVEGTRLGEGGDNQHMVSQTGNGYTSEKVYGEKDIDTWAAYIQDEWLVNDKLLVIPSVRYDHDSNFGGKASPKIGATYFISDNSRIKANWGKGFKAPTVEELYMNMHRAMGSMIVNVYGNSDLKPEESTNWDISFEAESDKDWGKLTYFHNDVDNLIYSRTLSTAEQIALGDYGVSARYENAEEATIKGIELELGHNFDDKWSIKATSNWIDAEGTQEDENGNFVWGDLEGRTDNISTLQLRYDDHNPYGISAILWNQWNTNYQYTDSDDNPKDYSFNTTNFVINKKFGEGNRVYAGVDNIFDKKVSDIGLDGMVWRLGAEWTF